MEALKVFGPRCPLGGETRPVGTVDGGKQMWHLHVTWNQRSEKGKSYLSADQAALEFIKNGRDQSIPSHTQVDDS